MIFRRFFISLSLSADLLKLSADLLNLRADLLNLRADLLNYLGWVKGRIVEFKSGIVMTFSI